MMQTIRFWVEVGGRSELASLRHSGLVETFVVSAGGSPVYGRPGDRLCLRIGSDHTTSDHRNVRDVVAALPLRAGVLVRADERGLEILTEARRNQRTPRAAVVASPEEARRALLAGATTLVVEQPTLLRALLGGAGDLPSGTVPVLVVATTTQGASEAIEAGATGLLVPGHLAPTLLGLSSSPLHVKPEATTDRHRIGLTFPRPGTIGALLERTAAAYPDRDAVIHVARGTRLSYADLRREARVVARALLASGVRPGDRVAIWARNVPEWPLVQLGVAYAGAILVTVNPSLAPGELRNILAHSESRVLMAAGRDRAAVTHLGEALQGLEGSLASTVFLPSTSAVLSEDTKVRIEDWPVFVAKASELEESAVDKAATQIRPDDVAAILYTSGTTGFPKGAMLTHRGMLQNAAAVAGNLGLKPHDRICLAVPFHHCFGSVMGTLAAVTSGAAMIVPADWFDAGRTLEAIAKERCTILYGVPTMFIDLLDHPARLTTDLASLRAGIIAGAPVPFDLAVRAERDLHLPGLIVAYGLTEASPVVTQTAPSDPRELRLGTVGRPIVGAEVRIVDPATGKTVDPGVPGELVTRGPMVMRGYFKMPEETRAAIDAAGWLHTGDLATRDPSGAIRIVGRIKDMILRGGENVYPAEIESVARRHPAVLDAQVVGVPSERLGEEIVAFVRLRPGMDISPEELRRYLAEELAPFKIPREVRIVDAYPLTASGKVRKDALREMATRVQSEGSGSGLGSSTTGPNHVTATLDGVPLPRMGVKQIPAVPMGRQPTPGWERPGEPRWVWSPRDGFDACSGPSGAVPSPLVSSADEVRTMSTEPSASLEAARRRGHRVKTWGLGGNVREQIEATGEFPIMYRMLGTPPQRSHPYNLYGDIRSQPDALRETLETSTEIKAVARAIANRSPLGAVGLGSGTSQFVAQVANAAYARFAGLPGWDYDSLHFLRYPPAIDLSRFVAMAYSGSGSTVDTVEAARRCREAGALTIAFTSVEGSPIVSATDARILTAGGFDTGGSDTFHYTCRIAAAIYLAIELGRIRQPDVLDYDELERTLLAIPRQMAEIFDAVDARSRTIAERYRDIRSILVVGNGPNYGTAEEIALKFDEMAHIPSKPMNAGRHIHGALGLTDESILTILVAPPGPSYPDMVALAKVTELLKTPSVAIVADDETEIADRCDYVVRLPCRDETIFTILAVLPGQLIPYWCGVLRGLNPDTQRSNVPKHAKVWNMLFPPGTH